MKKLLALLIALTTSLNAATVNLAWDPSPTTTPAVTYRVYSSAGTAPFALVLTTASTSATLTFSVSTRYYITAFNTNGESGPSNTLTITPPATPPAPPTNLRSTAISASRIDLQWEPPNDPFDIFVERNQALIAVVPNTQSFYLDTGLRKNRFYSYRVRGAGTEYSNTATARTFRH